MVELTVNPETTSVMILAAGRGKRMMPLTSDQPKPLLKIGNHSLLEHHLLSLQQAGFKQLVINLDYLGEQIRAAIGNGEKYDLQIEYSDESGTGALETAGGIINALSLIKSDPFLVINGDIYTDLNFATLLVPLKEQARLVLVNNPTHNPDGDFNLGADGFITPDEGDQHKLTFSGIGLYSKEMFTSLPLGPTPLAPLLRAAISHHLVEATHYRGTWIDIGTPERLGQINRSWTKNAT